MKAPEKLAERLYTLKSALFPLLAITYDHKRHNNQLFLGSSPPQTMVTVRLELRDG